MTTEPTPDTPLPFVERIFAALEECDEDVLPAEVVAWVREELARARPAGRHVGESVRPLIHLIEVLDEAGLKSCADTLASVIVEHGAVQQEVAQTELAEQAERHETLNANAAVRLGRTSSGAEERADLPKVALKDLMPSLTISGR
jgi:hypothetical protein